jgi:hypothetical protein
LGAGNAPAGPPPGATILNPGNTEYTGFAIAVLPDGRAWTMDATGRAHGQLSYALSQAFFADLAAAGPLAQIPVRQCTTPSGNMSAAQLGIYLAWHNQRSPNLQCGTDQRSDRLLADVTAIARALYVQAYRARPVVIGTGHSDAYRYSYTPPRSYSSSGYANAGTGGSYSANYGSSYGGGSYGGGGYGGGNYDANYGSTYSGNYGSNYGTYNAGTYSNNDFGVTPGSGFGGNPMSSIGTNDFGSSSFTSFSNSNSPFSVNVFGSSNPFSAGSGFSGDFGRNTTFGSNFGSGLPTSNLPSGSLPTTGFGGSGPGINTNIGSSSPH